MNAVEQLLKTLNTQYSSPFGARLQELLPLLASSSGAHTAEVLIQNGTTGDAIGGYVSLARYPASAALPEMSAAQLAMADAPYHETESDTWHIPLHISGQPSAWLRFTDVKASADFMILLAAQLHNSLQAASETTQSSDSPGAITIDPLMQMLYQINEALLRARDVSDVLQILQTHFTDAGSISYIDIQYNLEQQLDSLILRYSMRQGKLEEPNSVLLVRDEELRRLPDYWAGIGDNIEIIEDFSGADGKIPMLDFFRENNIASTVTIPVLEFEQRKGQISLVWDKARTFSPAERQLYNGIRTQIALVLGNIRFMEDVQRQANESSQQAKLLRTLNDLTAITVDTDEKHLLQQAAEMLVMLTDVDHSGITLINPNGTTATVVAEYPDRQFVGMEIEALGTTWDEMRETGRGVMIANVADVERVAPTGSARMQDLGISAVIFVPMMDLEKNLIGSVGLDLFSSTTQFDALTLDIAQTVVAQITLSLLRVRLLRSSQQQINQMQQLTQYSQIIQSQLEHKALLRSAVEQAELVVPADYVGISLYHKDSKQAFLAAERREDIVAIYDSATILASTGHPAIEAILSDQQASIVPDLSQAGWWHPQMSSLKSLMLTPLRLPGQFFGLIEVGSKAANQYNEIDLATFRQMANQLAVALENATAYEQSQRQARNKNLSNEIATKLQQQLDMEGIMATAIQELGQALGAKRARIRLGNANLTLSGRSE